MQVPHRNLKGMLYKKLLQDGAQIIPVIGKGNIMLFQSIAFPHEGFPAPIKNTGNTYKQQNRKNGICPIKFLPVFPQPGSPYLFIFFIFNLFHFLLVNSFPYVCTNKYFLYSFLLHFTTSFFFRISQFFLFVYKAKFFHRSQKCISFSIRIGFLDCFDNIPWIFQIMNNNRNWLSKFILNKTTAL